MSAEKLTQAELDAMPEKTKKHPAVVQLYMQHDFLTAYAKHTDLRVRELGYKGAIGAVDDWERHGVLQFEFLKAQGLQPQHYMLEIGCGTGRLARKVVPYLGQANYRGCDISEGALIAAQELAAEEGWRCKLPQFSRSMSDAWLSVDFVWAFSVFIHVPRAVMVYLMRSAAQLMKPDARFLFSYVPEQVDERTGLKQFRHTERTYMDCAERAGLTFERVLSWPGEQRMALSRRFI